MIFPELDGFAEVFVSQLRNDYIAAFLRFDLSNAFVSYMTALLMAPCAIQNDSGIFFSFTPNPRDIPEVGRMACLAIADAAMSIPLKVVLNSCHSLPSLEILAAIRRSPPDTRLNQITDYLRRNPRDFEEFIRKVAYYRLIEYKQFGKSGSTPRVAAELCSLVGLDHEASAGFPKDVWRKMGVELDFSVQEVSDRDASMKSNGLVVLSKPIGPGFLDMKEQASLDATIADHGEKCGNAPPLIVCEVGPGQDSDGNLLDVAVVSLYSFVADSAYARLKHFAHFVIHPPVVPTLPSLFRHCKWIWLTDMNRLGACGIATKELTGGDVYLPTNNLDSLGDMNLYSVGHRLPEGEQPPPDGVSKVPEYLPEGVHLAVIELPPNDWKEVRTWHVSFWLPLGPLNGRNRGNGEHSAIAHAMYWGTIYESASVSAGVHVRVRS